MSHMKIFRTIIYTRAYIIYEVYRFDSLKRLRCLSNIIYYVGTRVRIVHNIIIYAF